MPIGSNGPRRGRSDSRSAECPIGRRGSHARKHGITFEEAATVFADPLALIIEDESRPENARIIGESLAARTLLVVFIERDRDFVKLISARRATRHKRRRKGQHMDSSKDVLFLVLTSHGSEGQLSVSNRT